MATEDACKLFVAGLPDSVTEDVLREIFEAVGGTVVDVSLPRDRATGRPRGFGFVTFSTAEEASNARQSLDGSLQAGRSISVRPFSSEPPRRGEGRSEGGGAGGAGGGGGGASEDRTLYVGNLPYDASQQEVIAFLGEHGVTAISRVHLPAGPDGRPRGFGFVTLATADAANQAIISLRGVEVRGRRLLVNIAHPRGASPGGGGGGRGMGARPPHDGGGGWSGGGGGGGGGYSNAPPEMPAPGSRPDGRRRGMSGPPEGGEEGDSRNKKKKRGGGAAGKGRGGPPERGGGGNWRSWNRDDED
ncbi:MAG TPA: RNA-binding protein [Polyangiaceae bacterium]|nr:RNA-binding protein [Polyangiaceae bacterium]